MDERAPVRKHPRLKGYDYSRNGCYFVTVCTKKNCPILSRVAGRGLAPAESPRVELTEIGHILESQICALDRRFPSVEIDHYITHLHMIVSIRETAGASPRPTLSQVVGTCKSLTTRLANQVQNVHDRSIFQGSFHDHVIRSEGDYLDHRNYISGNPGKWREDAYYTEETLFHIKEENTPMMQNRTHTCAELRMEHVGKAVRLVGWMENVREVGGSLVFVVLRDFYGTTQLVTEDAALIAELKALNKESTIAAEGLVRERSSKNPKLPTGDIEIELTKIEVLGRCRYNELPFEINRSRDADESARLKYRYLDLRNPAVKKNILLRCNVIAALRKAMMDHGFLEITTPILTASSPEGARDYLVPARKHPGKFYALPQAPQQFKQLLMTSGFDRYFQIAPCFRDEDARGDRSPGEFYQLDMEMAFASQEDVFAVLEDVLPPIFAQYGTYNRASTAPFRRIPYLESMEAYGTDKPDLRIDLKAIDVTALLSDCGFEPFADGAIKAVPISGCALTRKQIDKLLADCEVQSGAKGYWFKTDETGTIAGGVAKFVQDKATALTEALGLKPNTLVILSAGALAVKNTGVVIKTFGSACEGHMDREKYEFCWIVDFPMYEIGDESGELEFCHNPFSMPKGGLETLLKAERGEIDPLTIMADQYDLVCNGVELSSGAVRNHDPEIMVKAFELVRLGEADVKAKFPAMYNAFCYGAPPHAGIAPGVDRMVMLLAGEDSIREIIPFPMNKNAQDVMMGAPGFVEQKQLDELHIAVTALEADG